MKFPIILLTVTLMTLVGCATVTEPVPPDDHPANPRAAAAPVAPASVTLSADVAIPEPPPTAHDAPVTGHQHGDHDDAAAPAPAQAAGTYTCPHHPEVAQAEPGICPKCKMKLVAAAAAEPARAGADHGEHGAPKLRDAGEDHGSHAEPATAIDPGRAGKTDEAPADPAQHHDHGGHNK